MARAIEDRDDLGLGIDWDIIDDLGERIQLVAGRDNLAAALLRRLQTPRGGLIYDEDYGYDVRELLSDSRSDNEWLAAGADIEAECLKDPRVQLVNATIDYSRAFEELTITLEVFDAEGPFELILSVDQVTVELLRGGVAQSTATTTATAAAPVVAVAAGGEPGPRGPSGPPGADGVGSFEVAIDLNGEFYVTDTTETVVFDSVRVDPSGWPATIAALLNVAAAKVSAGTGVLRLRQGGTEGAADGTILGSVNVTETTYTPKSIAGSFANPGASTWLKVTAAASGASETIHVRRPTILLSE